MVVACPLPEWHWQSNFKCSPLCTTWTKNLLCCSSFHHPTPPPPPQSYLLILPSYQSFYCKNIVLFGDQVSSLLFRWPNISLWLWLWPRVSSTSCHALRPDIFHLTLHVLRISFAFMTTSETLYHVCRLNGSKHHTSVRQYCQAQA